MDATALGVACVRGLIEKYKIDPVIVDDVIWGNVVVNTSAPNIAREIVIDAKLPRSIPGKVEQFRKYMYGYASPSYVVLRRYCVSRLSVRLASYRASCDID